MISLGIVLTMLATTLIGCTGKGDEEVIPESQLGMPSSEVSSENVVEEKPIVNPLTGEYGFSEELLETRPIAVMINNIAAALPQSGLAEADIVYEMQVEGAVTRLMAVYSDYKSIKNIGSIRSARHDYIELVKPLDAVYLHFGGSDAGKQAISNNGIDAIDGLAMSNVAFYMDKERAKTKSSDHCWFSNGELIQAGIDKTGIDMEIEPLNSLFSFAKPEDDVMAQASLATPANTIVAPITGDTKAGFVYDEKTGVYAKTQNEKPHIDNNYNEALTFKNVFLMYTDVGYLADGYHKEVDLSNGTGYYISNGKAIEVTYKKAAASDMIKVYNADGSEIDVNAGNSYFGIISNGQKTKLTIQ